MKEVLCARCGARMRRNGTTSRGTQRWRCQNPVCGSSKVARQDRTDKDFREFLDYLFGKSSLGELGDRWVLSRRFAPFWRLWPVAAPCDECLDVVHVDGIHLGRGMVVLIAMTPEGDVLGWSVAPTETSRAWGNLFSSIAPPAVVVCDGGGGISRALKECWPTTRVQRCLFHVLLNTTALVTSSPRLLPSKELRYLVLRLQHVSSIEEEDSWVRAYLDWRRRRDAFLKEPGKRKDAADALMHERLVRAVRQVDRRLREGTLFTYLDPGILVTVPVPAFNNRIESFNARLREMLRSHRGMGRDHQLKAIGWYCYERCANRVPLALLPTDEDVRGLRDRGVVTPYQQSATGFPEFGTGLVWTDFHSSTPYNGAYVHD